MASNRSFKTFDWLSILLVALGIAGLIVALAA
jgi:ABC-type lipoprotein release transport system permease subunit